jgi:hypothetical protein
MRRAIVLSVVLAAATLAPAAVASAAPLTAQRIRIADRPAFVRVVVDFTGGPVITGEVVATDPDPFRDGAVRLPLARPGVRTIAVPVLGKGVAARVQQGAGRIVIALHAAKRRFKYVGYRALHSPERLVIHLYKSAPPTRAAEMRRARGRCLELRRFAVGPRRVSARGRAHNLFEGTFVLRLRRRGGRIQDQRVITAEGPWRRRFGYPRARRQLGTLEAVAESAKDGTLECIVQVRVRLGG